MNSCCAMHRLSVLLLVALACTSDAPRRRRTVTDDPTLSPFPREVRTPFVAPASWERIKLPIGIEFSQPAGFTIGLNDALLGPCDSTTLPADSAVFQRSLGDRWPLTLAMRRGELARMAFANGFTIDTTEISAHGQQGDSTRVRRGEGWILLSGGGSLFATVRSPGGCHLVWAARGLEINVDTLGLVISTVRFGASTSAESDTSRF